MTEKQQIERMTVTGFLALYNKQMQTDYNVISFAEEGEVPDARCQDSDGKELNIEVTMTEDRPRDIQAMLGRSDHKSIESVTRQQERVGKGLEPIQYSTLNGNVLDQIVQRISGKFLKQYGSSTALVVRDASPLGWNWNLVREELLERLDLSNNPFDGGIWIVDYDKLNLYQITGDKTRS